MPFGDATWPLLIPIWTVAPPQAVFVEAIRTFHSPSNVAAVAGVTASMPRKNRMRVAKKTALRERLMALPFVPTQSTSQIVSPETVIELT
jgi:hypothetical protein